MYSCPQRTYADKKQLWRKKNNAVTGVPSDFEYEAL